MKRKPSMTEENFDKIMASAQTEEILKDEDNESKAEVSYDLTQFVVSVKNV